MRTYAGYAADTNTANTTQWSLSQPASALKRIQLSYLQIGSEATADNAFRATIRRGTADGTLTAFTAVPLDPADGAASAVFGYNHSVEPTYTANSEMLTIAGHQRSTFQWYAPQDGGIVIAATNDACIAYLTAVVTTAFVQSFTVHWIE